MQRLLASRRPVALATCVAAACVVAACSSSARAQIDVPPSTRRLPVPTTSTSPAATSTTRATLPSRIVVATTTTTAPAGFTARAETVTAADLGATYHAGCPVAPEQLRALHMTYWGFDGHAHEGTIVVAASVADSVIEVFRALYDARFPIRRMRPERAYAGSDPLSMADDNTSGFNCRAAVAPGPPKWSAHAFGVAIDVNPVENPYVEGGTVQPENGAAYVDRSRARAGMAEPGNVLNRAFAAAGWQWGGRWSGSPDYQHFSATGG